MREKFILRSPDYTIGLRFDGQFLLVGGPRKFRSVMEICIGEREILSESDPSERRIKLTCRCSVVEWGLIKQMVVEMGGELTPVTTFRRLMD